MISCTCYRGAEMKLDTAIVRLAGERTGGEREKPWLY